MKCYRDVALRGLKHIYPKKYLREKRENPTAPEKYRGLFRTHWREKIKN
jgi:hypothetical protein